MEQSTRQDAIGPNDSNLSGVSWAAVIAGASVAAALSLALVALGTGIGLSAVSPWANSGASASMIGWTAVIWLVMTQVIASSMGGYLAGRLRTKWVSVHTHEVYFRDTAHGFLVWAVGLLIMAAFLTSAAASLMGGRARTGAAMSETSAFAESRGSVGPNRYFIDTLLRSNTPNSSPDNPSLAAEIGVIFANGLREHGLPTADKAYASRVVAAKTGMSEPDAEKRVDDVFARTQKAADHARKAVAHSMYWTFLALLIGAFSASYAATIGGRQRDRLMTI